jgi:hypothetical protein
MIMQREVADVNALAFNNHVIVVLPKAPYCSSIPVLLLEIGSICKKATNPR